ncbi:MAG: Eco57I restriction-modification methylase domain-containing protein [Candidatus Hermodarchaeota archaeon]
MLKEKSMGQYFTPIKIAQLMINLISINSKRKKILEPSAGKGVFLKLLSQMGYQNLTGIEIDPSLVNQSPFRINVGNFFDYPISNKFSVVIGNPPYIRWKNLSLKQRQYFSSTSFWQKRMNGLTDILQPFIFKSIDHLETDGELIFITPLFWMQTLHAEPLRRFLLDNGSLEVVINFHEARIFPKVNLNLVIFKYRKGNHDHGLKVINYWQKGKLQSKVLDRVRRLLFDSSLWKPNSKRDGNLEYFETHQPLNSLPWHFLPIDIEQKLAVFEQACHFSPDILINGYKTRLSSLYSVDDLISLGYPIKSYQKVKWNNKTYFKVPHITQLTKYLYNSPKTSSHSSSRFVRIGDIVEIGNGMVSGLDKAFRLKLKTSVTKKEKKLLIQVVKAKAIQRYYAEFLTEYFLVKPGDILSEEILRSDYPTLYNQIKPLQEALEKRYQYNRKIPYWEWVFIRNYNLMRDAKSIICVPCKDRFDKRGFLRFALCKQGIFTTQDVTVLVRLNWVKESPEYITAFLNSKEVFDWVKNKGLVRGGVAEFSEEPLKNIPFRLINWNSSNERKIHNEIKVQVKYMQINKCQDNTKISKINELISRLLERGD